VGLIMRGETGEIGVVNFEKLSFGFFEEGMGRREIVGNIDEMLVGIVGFVNKIGVFHYGEEGEVRVKDVEPISILGEEIGFELEDEGEAANTGKVIEAAAVVWGKGGGELEENRGREGDKTGVKDGGLSFGFWEGKGKAEAVLGSGGDAVDGSGEVDLILIFSDEVGGALSESLEAAFKVAEFGASFFDAGPEPGGGNFRCACAELGGHEGSPEFRIDGGTHRQREKFFSGEMF